MKKALLADKNGRLDDSESTAPGGMMAKIRVYELARDLNMTNKDLLEKIASTGISVKNHMSTLDEAEVEKIRQNLYGAKPESVEEIRIKPTVIRRRKKVVPLTPSIEMEAEAEVAAEEPPAEEAPVEEKAEAAPEAPEPETAAPEKEEVAEIEAPSQQEEATVASTPEKTEAAEPVKEEEETAPEEEAKPSAKPKKSKKKVRKSDAPAKIIRLPVKPPVEVQEEKPISPEITIPEDVPTPAPETAVKEKKKKGKRAEKDESLSDRKFVKKKISFRRKSIVEGADLYGKGHRQRKSRKGAKSRPSATALKPQITTAKAIKRRIKVDESIVLSELAKRMGIKAAEMIRTLMGMDVMATVNQTLDYETAVLVASEFGYEVERAAFEEESLLKAEKDDPGKLAERPPVVTIMGHVDHGKTSLLDVIRKTRITEGEAGGITQHIGAYYVETEKGQIVFLDTPGHEAFTEMRARGAKVTDIVILVVAADDGVMPQTVEAVNHAKAAQVPIIVAVNKIDKNDADPDRVLRELSELGLTPEDWGGDTIFVHVSAKQNIGIDELLEMILLQSELMELKANPDKLARGHVIEAKLDSGRGPVATLLVTEGTLKAGDSLVCGVHHGKVRALINDRGFPVKSAGPSMPVEVIGLSAVPMAGDEMIALADDKDARQVSVHRTQKQRAHDLAKTSRMSLEGLFEKMQQGEVKDLNLIIKADVDGSIEALKDSVIKLSNEEVKIAVIHAATGTITESDVSLAAVSDAIIIGFNVRPTPKVLTYAGEESVDIRFHKIIYDVIKEIKDAILGMMDPKFEERTLGRAEVRDVFHIPKIGTVAGCIVSDGKIERGRQLRLLRDGIVLYEGKNSSLRRFKDDVKEVQNGYECGIGLENYNDIKIGDILECFYMEEIQPVLSE
jgi:translation initiation factor IF-2